MRWLHVGSVLTLLALAFFPASWKSVRMLIWLPLALALGTGLYNFMTKLHEMPKGYHMWFGIKSLLVAHIFAIYFMVGIGRGDGQKHKRWAIGVAISAFLAICAGEYLRYLRTHQ